MIYSDRYPTNTGKTDPAEYPWLYAIPGIIFGGGYIAAASTGMAGLVQAGYLASSLLCISKISNQKSTYSTNQFTKVPYLALLPS
jgi:H+-translocating NAD(P) transhydrogenase